jgi:N-carbamoyl-D-amino-acid hydrolase
LRAPGRSHFAAGNAKVAGTLKGLQAMTPVIRVAGAQTGHSRTDARALTLERLLTLLEGGARGAERVVFPELAFTTFFPRWLVSEAMLESFFERSMPNAKVEALFDRAPVSTSAMPN